MKISSTKFDNKNIVNIKKFNYKRLSAVAAVFVVGIFVIAMYNNNGQFEKEYEDINLVAPRLSDSLSLDRSVGDNSEYDMKYSELNNDENSENSIPYISEDDNVTAAKAGRSSIEMKYDTEANMNEYFDGNSGLNSDNIKDSIGDTDDISLNIESSERDMSNAIYSYDYYLELIEKDLIWTSFTVISWEKDSFDIYSFIIRLENDMKSESEQEYRLYKGSEGNILWEAINQ